MLLLLLLLTVQTELHKGLLRCLCWCFALERSCDADLWLQLSLSWVCCYQRTPQPDLLIKRDILACRLHGQLPQMQLCSLCTVTDQAM